MARRGVHIGRAAIPRALLLGICLFACAAPAPAIAEVIDTGAGGDEVEAGGGGDEVRSGEQADEVAGGGGDDFLAGGEGGDEIGGGAGGDLIVDLAGNDRVRGGEGDDRITVRDLVGGDRVRCGGGRDFVIADPDDRIAADCEDVLGPGRERTRRDARKMDGPAKRRLVQSILRLKRAPSPFDEDVGWYDQFVDWHEDVFSKASVGAHGGPGFLPWHRGFLLLYEDGLSLMAGEQVSLPYWNWTKQQSTDSVFSRRLMGSDGDPQRGYAVTDGPFQRGEWRLRVRDDGGTDTFLPEFPQDEEGRYIERALGTDPNTSLPTPATQRAILGVRNYDAPPWNMRPPAPRSFRNALEGFGELPQVSGNHNTVHVWTGGVFEKAGDNEHVGTMVLATSPNDPVFWLHHNNIDRIWEAWLRANGRDYRPVNKGPRAQRRDAVLRPFDRYGIEFTPGKLLRVGRLGYRYDSLPRAQRQSRAEKAEAIDWMRCTVAN